MNGIKKESEEIIFLGREFRGVPTQYAYRVVSSGKVFISHKKDPNEAYEDDLRKEKRLKEEWKEFLLIKKKITIFQEVE